MQVMVLNEDRGAQDAQATALAARGFSVVIAEDVPTALAEVRKGAIDVLVMAERVKGRLSHAVALSAECHNPWVATVLLTGRTDPEVDELFDLLPSIHAILGHQVGAEIVARLAFTSVSASIRAKAPLKLQAAAEPVATFASSRVLANVA